MSACCRRTGCGGIAPRLRSWHSRQCSRWSDCTAATIPTVCAKYHPSPPLPCPPPFPDRPPLHSPPHKCPCQIFRPTLPAMHICNEPNEMQHIGSPAASDLRHLFSVGITLLLAASDKPIHLSLSDTIVTPCLLSESQQRTSNLTCPVQTSFARWTDRCCKHPRRPKWETHPLAAVMTGDGGWYTLAARQTARRQLCSHCTGCAAYYPMVLIPHSTLFEAM